MPKTRYGSGFNAQCRRTFNLPFLCLNLAAEHGTGHLKLLLSSRVGRSGTLPAAASVGGGGRGVSSSYSPGSTRLTLDGPRASSVPWQRDRTEQN